MKITNAMELEIDRRVKDKLDAVLAHIESASRANHIGAFYVTLSGDLKRGQEFFEKHIGLEWIKKLFNKEKQMAVPYTMIEKFKERRNIAVDEILEIVHPLERRKVNSFVKIIEKALSQ